MIDYTEELKRKSEEYVRTLRVAGINSYNHCDVEKAYCKGYEQGYEDCRHYAHDYYKSNGMIYLKKTKLSQIVFLSCKKLVEL